MSKDVSRTKQGTKLNEEFRTPALLPFSLSFPEKEGEDTLGDKFEHPGSGREGKKAKSEDYRPKLNSLKALQEEKMHAYMVRGSDNCVPHAVIPTSNPDVSGFTNQLCKSSPRSTNAGEESLKGAMIELRRAKK